MSGKSFGITMNIKHVGGVKKQHDDKIIKALDKTKDLDGYVIIAEKEDDERHLHMQLWYKTKKTTSDITRKFKRLFEKEDWYDPNNRKWLKVEYAYNNWVDKYCIDNEDKENDKTEIVIDKTPEDTETYYPTLEEQNKYQQTSNKEGDKRFQKLELDYHDWDLDHPKKSVHSYRQHISRFLNQKMFIDRTMRVILQQRDRIALANTLYTYIYNNENNIQAFETKEDYEIYSKQIFEYQQRGELDKNLDPIDT